MRRRVHSSSNNLDWTVRRLWLPEAVRPVGVRQMHSGAAGPSEYAGLGVILSPLFSLVVSVPTMIVVLPLRFAGMASWEVQAVARPWGRRGPATILRWRVKGWRESAEAVKELAAALERGETQPSAPNAIRDD